MSPTSRRDFLKKSTAAGLSLALSPHARVLGANDAVRVGVIGLRNQGRNHVRWMRSLPGVRVVAVCDPDADVLAREVRGFENRDEPVAAYADLRKLLESKEVDAVSIATPDHWHCLAAIWACQAGKDVYVEKPLSYCIFEGRQAVEATRKYNRIVQWGDQSHDRLVKDLHLSLPGLGRIEVAYAAMNRMRHSIGKVNGPQPVPPSVNYDLWCGPAPKAPLRRKRLHYDWHWVWSTGTGEIGNNGIYPLDAVRVALGQRTMPRRVMSIGGRFLFADDGQTPNTQLALLDYDPGPLVIFEVRNLPSKQGPKTRSGRVKCERGEAPWPSQPRHPGSTGGFKELHQQHMFNFISAVRSRKPTDLRAPLLEGHLSSTLVHLANISYRLGADLSVEQAREVIQDRGPEAEERFVGMIEHLRANEVDFSHTRVTVGPWLEFDSDAERFVGNGELVQRANALVKRTSRQPFVVPETV